MKDDSKFKVQGSNIEEKIKRIKMLLLDVDGVLTDGSIVYDTDGRELKSFNVKDGHGIKLLMRAGVKVGIITSRESKVVLMRAKDLGIEIVYQRAIDKAKALDEIVAEEGLSDEDVAFIGDDLVDLPVLRRVGFSVAVADAIPEVKESADYVTHTRGGYGAVREVCELILKVQDRWEDVTQRYFATHI